MQPYPGLNPRIKSFTTVLKQPRSSVNQDVKVDLEQGQGCKDLQDHETNLNKELLANKAKAREKLILKVKKRLHEKPWNYQPPMNENQAFKPVAKIYKNSTKKGQYHFQA